MSKEKFEQVFHEVDGIWQDPQGKVLADVLSEWEIIVDDRTQFARLYDYDRGWCIYYRVAGGRITLSWYSLEES